jgi:hypothetical protein
MYSTVPQSTHERSSCGVVCMHLNINLLTMMLGANGPPVSQRYQNNTG